MSKKSFAAATKALLNAQKVDAEVSTDECGNIAIRKSPWNDTQVIADHPKVISATSSTSSRMRRRARRNIRRLSILRMAP